MDRGASVCSPFLEGAPLRVRASATSQAAMALALPPLGAGCHRRVGSLRAEASSPAPPRTPRRDPRLGPRAPARVDRGRPRREGSARRRVPPSPPPHLEDVLLTPAARPTWRTRCGALWRARAISRWMPPRATGGTPRRSRGSCSATTREDLAASCWRSTCRRARSKSKRRRVDERFDEEKLARGWCSTPTPDAGAYVGEYVGDDDETMTR